LALGPSLLELAAQLRHLVAAARLVRALPGFRKLAPQLGDLAAKPGDLGPLRFGLMGRGRPLERLGLVPGRGAGASQRPRRAAAQLADLGLEPDARLLGLAVHLVHALLQPQDHLDPGQVDAQVVDEALDAPQLFDVARGVEPDLTLASGWGDEPQTLVGAQR